MPQWVRGVTTRQAHVGLPPGTVEEEHGRSGFYGPASHLYRLHAPTDWVAVEGPAAHHAYDTRRLVRRGRPLAHAAARQPAGVDRVASLRGTGRSEFLRDADGDQLCFVHAGTGRLRTEYGPLDYRPGDYLVVPRGTTYRFEPSAPTDLLVVEACGIAVLAPRQGAARPPRPVRSRRCIEVPEAEAVEEDGRVHRRGEAGRRTTPASPTRSTPATWSAGRATWRRCGSTSTTSARSPRPATTCRRRPTPPSSPTASWCAPSPLGPLEEDPEALRLPFFHRNVDYDEVIFYHRGEFFSRAGIDEGMLTWHPFGLHHGPQPGARARDAAAAADPHGRAPHGRRGGRDDRRPPRPRAR